MVYGDLLDTLYGRLTATDAARIHVLEDGEDIEVSANRTLTTVDSPGHAKHHLALHDSESGLLFAGDAVGVRLPVAASCARPRRRPTSTSTRPSRACGSSPPAGPSGVALAHFGLVPDPLDTLAEAEETLTRWAEVAEAAWRGGGGHRRRPRRRLRGGPRRTSTRPPARCMETLNGIHSNAAGFRRWLDTRAATATATAPVPASTPH